MKTCTKCLEEKSRDAFHKDSESLDGIKTRCKVCIKEADRVRHSLNKEKDNLRRKEYRLKNIEKERAKGIAWSKDQWINNRDHISKRCAKYSATHTAERAIYNKKYRELNSDKLSVKDREYYLKTKHVIISRNALKRAFKVKATPSWANLSLIRDIYKMREILSKETGVIYHVDHIIPLKGKSVCGLHVEYNLQVIPAYENLTKSNKLIL